MANFVMSLVTQPIEKFRDHVLNHICYAIHVGANVRALDDEVDKLKRKRKDVEDEIARGDTAGKVATEEAKGWLVTAAKLEEEASIISSKYRDRNCMFLGTGCSFNCFSNHSIGMSSIEAKAKVAAEIQRLENNIKEITKDPPPPTVQRVRIDTLGAETGSEIKLKLDKALDFLRSSPEGTLGIWGMGGVGKTTLLWHINNALAKDPSSFGYNRVVLVTASRGCTTEKIRELIAEELKLAGQEAHDIFNYLEDKSFVILLDDLWERLDLENVGVPTLEVVGEVKHKLIMATRSQQVCLDMDARDINIISVDCLSPEKARKLFKEKVGEETIGSDPLIPGLADTVADECGGLPMALIAIARAMAGTKQVNLWDKAIEDLRESKPSEISGMDRRKDPLPVLKISYDYLNDPRMQECLLLCALWPEDQKIPLDEVIECWMGHNLLGEFANLKTAYNKGYEIIDSLLKASLLEYSEGEDDIPGEGRVSLHDLIRDMALWIARDCGANDKKWGVLLRIQLKEAPQDERSWKEAHKMSLMYNDISTWPSHIQSAPNLTTLIVQNSLSNSKFFEIHDLDILRNLHGLKYLDMSGNKSVQGFPIAICQLDKLEYLNLSGCDIHSLPHEVKNLKSLKYLLLRENYISKVSSQLLPNLVSLEVLDLFNKSGFIWNDQSWIMDNLECLERRHLKSLGINVSSQADLNKLARFAVVPIIRDLCIYMRKEENLTSSIHLLPRLNSPCDGTWSDLNKLRIVGGTSRVIEKLVIDKSHGSLPNCLHLYDFGVKEIVWKGVEQTDVIPKLRDIELFHCGKLKHVSWIVNLPRLERLVLIDCSSIQHVVCEEATETATLPSLKILTLCRLPELESICNRALITLPSLQVLSVINCPRLKKLPFDSPASCSKLRKIEAQEKWWKSTLELDDDMRTYLQPFCDVY